MTNIEYNRTFDGLTLNMFGHHKERSIQRKHKLPPYTLTELREWVRLQPGRAEMFKSWRLSSYDKELTPSIDRLDDDIGYTFNNMRLVPWHENNTKEQLRKGRGESGMAKKVIQLKHGKVVGSFVSAKEAYDKTGVHSTTITRCCRGERKSAGGYQWINPKED